MPNSPIGRSVRNLLDLHRYANHLSGEARRKLGALREEFAAILARNDPTAVLPRYQAGRIQKILEQIRELTGAEYDELLKDIRQNLAELGSLQSDWARDQLKASIGTEALRETSVVLSSQGLGQNFFKSIVDQTTLQGHTLKQWFGQMQRKTAEGVERQIQLGLAQNETLQQMVIRVRGRSNGRGGFIGGVMQASTRDAETVIRTAVNHVSNQAHLATYKQNDDVVTKLRFTATLDSRTSDICISLDGKEWDLDDENVKTPPLHPNCRSVLTPVVDWDALGLEPPPEGTRASAGGQVPAGTTYEDWLKAQPAKVQDEILGKTKGKLFRDGKLSLRDLVKRDGSTRTLDELAS